jgi:hypothetical protein
VFFAGPAEPDVPVVRAAPNEDLSYMEHPFGPSQNIVSGPLTDVRGSLMAVIVRGTMDKAANDLAKALECEVLAAATEEPRSRAVLMAIAGR